jgi:hypothetical protein
MVTPRVLVCSSNRDAFDKGFAAQLIKELSRQGIHTNTLDNSDPQEQFSQDSATNQWFLLVNTPTAATSPRVRDAVNKALDMVVQRQIQGVLAIIASPSDPATPQPGEWSIIRTYDGLGENYQKALDKVVHTVKYTSSSGTQNRPPVSPPPRPAYINPRSVLIAALTIILVVVSIAAFRLAPQLAFSPPHPALSATQVKATANAKVLLAQQRATAAAQAQVAATATTIADILTSPAPNGKDIYTLLQSQTPALTSFSAQGSKSDNNSLWPTKAPCASQKDGYHVSTTPGHLNPCLNQGANFQNFAYQATVTVLNGDSAGLMFRYQSPMQFYRFFVTGDGQYKLVSCQIECSNNKTGAISPDDGTKQAPAPSTSNPVKVKPIGQANTLTVFAFDKYIYLYINGAYIGHIVVTGAEGDTQDLIGLYTGSASNSGNLTTEAKFSNVKVWQF